MMRLALWSKRSQLARGRWSRREQLSKTETGVAGVPHQKEDNR
jgi:hypothetical protein